MTTSSNSISFSQYLCIPYIGEAYTSREDTRRYWLPFFHLDIHREGDTCENGQEVKGGGAIRAFCLRAGRVFITVDRPRMDADGSLTWNQTAWLTTAAPALILATASACLFGGLFKTLVAKPLGWTRESRPDLLPET